MSLSIAATSSHLNGVSRPVSMSAINTGLARSLANDMALGSPLQITTDEVVSVLEGTQALLRHANPFVGLWVPGLEELLDLLHRVPGLHHEWARYSHFQVVSFAVQSEALFALAVGRIPPVGGQPVVRKRLDEIVPDERASMLSRGVFSVSCHPIPLDDRAIFTAGTF
jgi:hypothetical protein